ncbi:hypothetical protein [Xanthomonas phage RTH11]|nr:hypothetical protein [Xanthomonas phage RTH11]
MNETITIQHNAFADAAAVAAFREILLEVLADEGSTPTVVVQKVGPFQLDGNQFRVVWMGGYSFASPDGFYTFSEQDLRVEVESIELDFDAYTKLVAGRSRAVVRGYRNALRGIFNMATALNNGAHVPSTPVNEYVQLTLEAAVNAFPNSN